MACVTFFQVTPQGKMKPLFMSFHNQVVIRSFCWAAVQWITAPPDFLEPLKLSDVVLVVEEQRFHVHRGTLAFWSPVFERMFTSDFKEKNSEEIPLPALCMQLWYVLYLKKIVALFFFIYFYILLIMNDWNNVSMTVILYLELLY